MNNKLEVHEIMDDVHEVFKLIALKTDRYHVQALMSKKNNKLCSITYHISISGQLSNPILHNRYFETPYQEITFNHTKPITIRNRKGETIEIPPMGNITYAVDFKNNIINEFFPLVDYYLINASCLGIFYHRPLKSSNHFLEALQIYWGTIFDIREPEVVRKSIEYWYENMREK